jgi:chorismate mutase/prephenate dehydratase
VSSNAEAARLAAADPTVAAIAGDVRPRTTAADRVRADPGRSAQPHALRDRRQAAGRPSGHDQTSLIVSVKNEPGAVFKLLEPLARHGVSMTRFESRPARVGTWEYYFYIDIEGHRDDAAVAAALAELGQKAAFLKMLGSYPRAR